MSLIDFERRRRWLFCMTHPDDEISCCVTIKKLVEAGHEVHVSWTHSPEIRYQEGVSAARLLGVQQSNLHRHNSTDGSTCDELALLISSFSKMMEIVVPDVVVCGAFEQGHLDHDSTNWLVNQVFRGPVLEVPFYHSYLRPKLQKMNCFSDPLGQEEIRLTRNEQRFKLDFAKQFRSQNIWRVLLTYEVVSTLLLQPAKLRERELFRLQTHRNFREPNHPPALRFSLEKSMMWKRWIAALDKAEVGTL